MGARTMMSNGLTPAQDVNTAELSLQADEHGIQGRGGAPPLSVSIAGRPVWSFRPARDATTDQDGRWRVDWPVLLEPYLDGVADIVVTSLDTGAALLRTTVQFGDATREVRIERDGLALAIDKGGFLTPMFGARDEAMIADLLDNCTAALDLLAELEVNAFLAFGCLLGAVREGRLIAHDNDADIIYLAAGSHPFDVVTESLRLERAFQAHGFRTRRMSGGDFKLMPEEDTGWQIDIFAGFYRGDRLFSIPSLCADLPLDSLLPLSTVVLEGRPMTAPRDPERVLSESYGPNWRVPDPTFKFAPTRRTRRVLAGFLRGERRHQRYWDDFYEVHADQVPTTPSSFAEFAAADAERALGEPSSCAVIDVGSGTGRDSLHFARRGYRVLGLDYSRSGVKYSAARARAQSVRARFDTLNLYDMRDVLVSGAQLARRDFNIVYARFLVHALEDEGRENLWLVSRSALRGSAGRLYLEFRSEATEHEYGEHFRHFVPADVVVGELEGHGFEIEGVENRHGLAVYKKEDPRICRIVAKLRRAP
jgi:SAM-dependent methyltransferase